MHQLQIAAERGDLFPGPLTAWFPGKLQPVAPDPLEERSEVGDVLLSWQK